MAHENRSTLVETDDLEVIQRKLDNLIAPVVEACGCMGPQGDEPVCPCAMASVIRYRGHWIQLSVLAPKKPAPIFRDGTSLVITGCPEYKVPVIRVLREQLGIGLLDAKMLATRLPATVPTRFGSRYAQQRLAELLQDAGATVEFR